MIIDALTHITPDGKWFNTGFNASEKQLLTELEEESISKAVVVAIAGLISNEFVLKTCSKNKDILLPGGSINPASFKNAAEAKLNFRHEFYNSEFKVLKLHPRFNKYDPLDPRTLAILEELSSWEKKIPVWLDTLFYHKEAKNQKGPVESIHFLATTFPDLTFVLLHSGGSYLLNFYEAIRDCENVYLDFSFAINKYKHSSLWNDYKFLIRYFDKRILFGSDFPEVSIKEAVSNFNCLSKELHDLKDVESRFENIYQKNIQQIMGL